MANDDTRAPDEGDVDFVSRASVVFARELFQPMFDRARIAPDDVRSLIFEFRHKLDALATVVETIQDPLADEQGQPHPTLQAALVSPVDPDRAANGVAQTALPATSRDAEPPDDIGRNQRSRLRELTLLDFLSRDTHPKSLQQVLAALQAKGFDGSTSAVVSQLHRLRKLDVIHQPANGMYQITTSGLSHLHEVRASFGSLLDDR